MNILKAFILDTKEWFDRRKTKKLILKLVDGAWPNVSRTYLGFAYLGFAAKALAEENAPYNYQGKFNIGDVSFVCTRLIRGDLIEVLHNDQIIIRYADQTFQYQGFITDHDWTIEVTHKELLKLLHMD